MKPETFILEQFVIYERPADYPEGYVVRRWTIGGEGTVTPGPATRHASLVDARSALPFGLVPLAPDPADAPCIIEVWT